MTFKDITTFFSRAPVLAAAFVALTGAVAWFGGHFKSPAEVRLEVQAKNDSVHADIYRQLALLKEENAKAHAEDLLDRTVLEGIAIGECLENDLEDLARQKLLAFCRRLELVP